MAALGWRTESSLLAWLEAEPYRFDFFQAVKLLELARGDAEGEAVRFASSIRLDFPPSDIESITAPADGAPASMVVNFFGIAGGEGPLPPPLVELLQERMRERDFAARDFLDIFNHRLLTLLFQGARAHRPALAARGPEDSAAAGYLRALAGAAHPGLRQLLGIENRALPFYAGLLWQRPHSAAGLQRLLSDYFQLPFALKPLRGRWQALPPEEWTVLSAAPGKGRHQALGDGAALGRRVWHQAGGFELEAGPLTLAQFLDLLPGGEAVAALRSWTRLYAGRLFAVTLCLVLRAEQVPAARLGASRLGWTSWLPSLSPRLQPGRVRFAVG